MSDLRDALAAALEKEMIRRTGKCVGCVGLANAALSDPAVREALVESVAQAMWVRSGRPVEWDANMTHFRADARSVVGGMLEASEWDGTEGASPEWWRGCDHGVEKERERIRKAVEGLYLPLGADSAMTRYRSEVLDAVLDVVGGQDCDHLWVTDGLGPTRCEKCRKVSGT